MGGRGATSSIGKGSKAINSKIEKVYQNFMSGKGTLEELENLQKQMKVGKAEFTQNNNSVKSQNAVIDNGSEKIDIRFYSQYNPLQIQDPKNAIKSEIEVVLYKNGNVQGIRYAEQKKSSSIKNAKKQYEEVLKTFEKVVGIEKQ